MSVVRAYVGVTDESWYQFLAARPQVTEVNFWQPTGARAFRVLAPGEPFFSRRITRTTKSWAADSSATQRGCGCLRRGSSSATLTESTALNRCGRGSGAT